MQGIMVVTIILMIYQMNWEVLERKPVLERRVFLSFFIRPEPVESIF